MDDHSILGALPFLSSTDGHNRLVRSRKTSRRLQRMEPDSQRLILWTWEREFDFCWYIP